MESVVQIIKPGDLVKVLVSDDVLIKVGSFGIVERQAKDNKVWDLPRHVMVTFNPTTPWMHPEFDSASVGGGPDRRIFPQLLTRTEEFKRQTQYHPGPPQKGQKGVNNLPSWHEEERQARVWLVDLQENHRLWKELRSNYNR